MKTRFMLLLMALGSTAQANGRIQIVQNGAPVEAGAGATLTSHLVSLVRSCSVDTTRWAVHDGVWSALLESADFVRVTLDPGPQKITTEGAGDFIADEIFVRLGVGTTPDHIFMKAGDRVRSCAKYSPKALLDLAREPALNLADARPFSELAKALR